MNSSFGNNKNRQSTLLPTDGRVKTIFLEVYRLSFIQSDVELLQILYGSRSRIEGSTYVQMGVFSHAVNLLHPIFSGNSVFLDGCRDMNILFRFSTALINSQAEESPISWPNLQNGLLPLHCSASHWAKPMH